MNKLNMKGASWDSLFLSFSKGLTMIFSIITAKILSVGLTLEGYGTYSQANLVMTTGSSIILFGLADALTYYFNKKNNELEETLRCRIVNTVFFIEIIAGFVFAVITIVGRDLIAGYFSNDSVKNLLCVVALLPAFTNILYFMQVLSVSVGRAKKMSIYNLALTIIRLVSVYLAVYIFENIIWVYVSILSFDVLNVALYNHDLKKERVKINPFKISAKHIKSIVKYALPMGIYAVANTLMREIDKFVIGGIGGTKELAIYANCSKLLPLDFFVSSFAVVLIPYIYRSVSEGKRDESVDLFSSYLKIGYYTVWALGIAILVSPTSMISFLYADEYVAGKWVFILYILDNMIRFASIHLILTAAGKLKHVMWCSIVSLIVNLWLNILFYYLWGMIGPAIATVMVSFAYMFFILNETKRTIKAKWTDIFDIKDLIWFSCSLIIVWIAAFFLNKLLIQANLHIYISMIMSMGLFGASILLLHFKRIFKVLKKINTFKLQ